MKKTFAYTALSQVVLLAIAQSAIANEQTVQLDEISVVGSVAKAGKVEYMTPRSVSVLSKEQSKEWNLKQLDETLRYEAGASSQIYGSDLDTNDWFKMRGLDSRLTIDGAAVYNTGYSHWTPNMYGVESVEIVKGADSLTYGSAQTGGLVNLVTKRPTLEPQGEINLTAGNRYERGVSADVSNRFSDNLRYRLVGIYHKQHGELKGTWQESYYFAPSLTWDISKNTALTLLASVQKDVGVPTTAFFSRQGTLFTDQGTISRETNLGDPTSDYLDRKQYSLGYEFTHKFADNYTFNQSYHYNMQDVDQSVASYGGWGAFPNLAQSVLHNDVITRSHTIDNRISKLWKTDRFENILTVGTDYQHLTANGFYNSFYSPGITINAFNPVYQGAVVPKSARPLYDVTQRQLGFYVQDQFRINNWHLNFGVRNDRAKGEEISGGSAQKSYKVNHTSYSGGVMYVADNGLSPYFSYSESFLPETAKYKPQEGRQYEVGVKYLPSFIDGTISVAYFDLKQKNSFTPSVTGADQRDGIRSRGVELSADLNLTDKTKLSLAYAYTKAEDIKTGFRPVAVPHHAYSARVSHKFLDNLTAGVAVRYVGTTANNGVWNEAYETEVPVHTIVDLMAKYQFAPNWELQANVSNLTDKKYIASCFNAICYYGEGRKLTANVSYKF